jgi:GT2 family glycosyltransferase/glycosyltransferase involved in cell wall biosynthesis
MRWFLKPLIYPLLDALDPRVLIEVGADLNGVTLPLLRWAREHEAVVHAIDPDPALSVKALQAEHGERLQFHRARSLEVLGEIGDVDVALIDGDHNWYTVVNELRALERRAREDARNPPVVVVHETGWPYGRRDGYDDPEAVPEAHRHPHARRGVVPGRAELGPGLYEHRENALLEGTPANGVLSAVEDFLAESEGAWRSWSIPGLGGAAVLADAALLDAATLGELLDSIDTPAFLRAQCEEIEQARIQSERKRAGALRRLAETQLKQVTRSPDPHETVGLKQRVRELTEQVRELRGELERVDELEEQIRVLTLAPVAPPTAVEAPDAEPEQEAWRTLLDLYLPIVEQALPCEDGRDPLSPPCPLDVRGVLCAESEEQEPGRPSVDVVVCVHDALEELRLCLWSLLAKSGRRLRLILVNDGSDEATTRFVQAFADRHPAVRLIHREPPYGYTLAANRGLEVSTADYAILLNSDTVLSAGWLHRLIAHGEAHPEVGILGPLSNAATHQSVPEVRDGGAWATNPLPQWLTVDGMALIVERGAPRTDTRLPFLNGFCYALKREAIEAVGQLDEERFATGYCEENDYSQRARQAGFELAVADDVYVHHAKSRSFGADGRAELAKRNYETFVEKHGREEIGELVAAMEADRGLEPVRAAVAARSSTPEALAPLLAGPGRRALSVVFLLPGLAHGGSGGAHSVYQEAQGLRSLGVPARILLPQWDRERATGVYEDAQEIFDTFSDEEDLCAKTADADVISATHHKSVAMLQAIRARRSDFLPAYYVQDYEPFFTASYMAEEAIASYTALPDMLLFAKSHWLCNVVAERHGLSVEKVEASLDRELFAPGEGRRERGPLRVVAMVRPRTARRQPLATIAVLEGLRERFGDEVQVSTFGCYADELREILPGAESVLERHLGMLNRAQVAAELRRADVFLDMSVYQAFGRTALEAMACGATAVVPTVGGAWEFVEHERNALAVDTLEPAGALEALGALMADRELLRRLQAGARATAARYSIARAALSEYLAFERAHRARFGGDEHTPAGGKHPATNGEQLAEWELTDGMTAQR